MGVQGIIHRDLKANNIFCSAHGIVKLGDFGISKALGDNQNVARTMVGTPYYMSPEILKVSILSPLQCSLVIMSHEDLVVAAILVLSLCLMSIIVFTAILVLSLCLAAKQTDCAWVCETCRA